MKKVLKLILLVAVISALTVAAFAASPEVTNVENQSGASELTNVSAEVPENLKVEVVAPTAAAANEDAAKAANPDALILDSFDVNVTNTATGEEVHEGATVTLTITVPEEYVGGTLYLYEDGALNQTVPITSTTVTVVINSFSTYTPVLVKKAAVAPAPGPVTPQTMQTILPYAIAILAVAAVAVAVVAKKRSFN